MSLSTVYRTLRTESPRPPAGRMRPPGSGASAASRAVDGHEVPALTGRSGPERAFLGRAQRATEALEADREPLPDRQRSLPALRVEVGAAQRAARRKRRDALTALGAIARVHGGDHAARPSTAAKRNVSCP